LTHFMQLVLKPDGRDPRPRLSVIPYLIRNLRPH